VTRRGPPGWRSDQIMTTVNGFIVDDNSRLAISKIVQVPLDEIGVIRARMMARQTEHNRKKKVLRMFAKAARKQRS
jgi:hypothetical protein